MHAHPEGFHPQTSGSSPPPSGGAGEPSAAVRALLDQEVPRFSAGEMARRRAALLEVAEAEGVDLVLLHGLDRAGSAVQWLTGWPVTREAVVIVERDERDVMLVQHHNHAPQARRLAADADVRWGGPSTTATLLDELGKRGAAGRRVGVVGPVTYQRHAALVEATGGVVDLSARYTRLRLVKSDEELDWLRAGAYLSDRAVSALRAGLRPGLTEHALVDFVERAYVPLGGQTHIHYLSLTPMADPDRSVPAQYTSGRRVEAGDAVVCELSAAFWGYSGQVLRTITVAAPPTPLYRRLHEVASAAFDAVVAALRPGATQAEVVEAAGLIEEAGFTTVDDLVHGFGGGYLPPVLGSRSRPAGPLGDLTFAAGMTVVVQPNVTTPDGRAGVQTGELVLITDDGVERLHSVPDGLWTAGDGSGA
jgi:Xaa-Pro dipeptidase